MPLSQEELDGYDRAISAFGQAPIAARAKAVDGANANPEEAAKSLQLGAASGVHPSIIDLDHNNFEEVWKQRVAGEAVAADPHLQEYVNNYPLAHKVSNDDWDQLSTIGKMAASLGNNPIAKAIEGFHEGFGDEPVGTSADIDTAIYKLHGLDSPEVLAARKAQTEGGLPIDQPIAYPNEVLQRLFSGALRSVAKGAGAFFESEKVEKEVGSLAEWYLTDTAAHGGHIPPETLTKAKELIDHGKSYADAGETPSPGVHEEFDKVHKEIAKADSKALKEAEGEANKSATKERSPEALEAFLQRPTQGRTIGISADAIRELYGDKEPEVGDGILGWVPGLAEQLRAAEKTRGDIDISLAGWLARTEPEVQNALHDHVRVRPEGMSLFETKGPEARAKGLGVLPEEEPKAEPPKEQLELPFEEAEYPVEGPEDLARKEAALAPMVESGRSLRLRKFKTDEEGYTQYDIYGDRGPIGRLTTALAGSKDFKGEDLIYVEQIEGMPRPGEEDKPYQANTFGPSAIRRLIPDLRKEYPTAKHIGGYRISGAREGKEGSAWVEMPLKDLDKEPAAFAEALGWTSVEDGTVGSNELLSKAQPGGESVYLNRRYAKTIYTFKAKDLLGNINLDHLPQIPKLLQGFFRGRLADQVGHLEVRVISPEGMAQVLKDTIHRQTTDMSQVPGFYHPEGDYVVLNQNALSYSPRAFTHLIMHELDHGATWNVIENNPQIKSGIESVMGELRQNFPEVADEYDYAFQHPGEFVAEARSNPRLEEELTTLPLSKELREKLGLSSDVKTMWDAIRNFVSSILEKLTGVKAEGTALDAMLKFYQQMEEEYQKVPGEGTALGPIEDPLLTNGKAFGFSKKGFEKYQDAIEKQETERQERELQRAMKEEARRASAEWKAAEKEVRAQKTEEIDQRPDIAADDFLREGPFGRQRLSADALSEDQKASLPKHFYGKDGISPSALAGQFGFSSGEALIARLSNLAGVRAGLDLEPREYKAKLVDEAVKREMDKRFGDPEETALARAREAVRPESNLERLHEETFALATKAGEGFEFTKDQIKKSLAEDFKTLPMAKAKDPKYLIRNAGAAGRAVEEALLRGDFKEAFRQKQRQYFAETLLKESFKLEREHEVDAAFRKRHSAESLKSTDQGYLDQIHGILLQTGSTVKRSVQAIQEAVAKGGSLESFVDERTDPGGHYQRTMPVADILYDPAFKKSVDEMNVGEFRAVRDSLKTLAKNGRDELTLTLGGEKIELEKTIGKMEEKLAERGLVSQKSIQRPKGIIKSLRSGWSKLITVENTLDHLSSEDPLGIFNQLLANKMTDATRREMELTRDHANKLAKIKYKGGDLSETIENPFFIHQSSKQPMIMNRENFLRMLQNVGNKSNFEKLVRGYEIQDPDALMAWIQRTAKKEDWEYVQAHGKAWEPIAKLGQDVDERTSGLPFEKLPLEKVDTGHPELGEIDGWYHPVIFDRSQPGSSKTLMGKLWDEANSDKFYRATTPRGYQTKRTNYKQALSFDSDVASRIQQAIHDIAFREAIEDINKFAYNTRVRQALVRHVGPDFSENFANWVEAKAFGAQFAGKQTAALAPISNFMRQNAMTLYIGFNIGTVEKHGPTAFVNSLATLMREFGPSAALDFIKDTKNFLIDAPFGGTSYQWLMENSREFPLRGRHWVDQAAPAIRSTLPTRENWFFNARDAIHHLGSLPVGWSDMLSSGPMTLTAYRKYSEMGYAHGDAITAADNLMVKAHGSITVKPLILNEVSPWMTMIYGFWSNQFQRAVRLGWHSADAWDEGLSNGIGKAAKNTVGIAAETFSVLVWPAIVEELVSPMVTDDHEGKLWKATKMLFRLTGGMVPMVRDFANAVVRGSDPNFGMLGSLFKPHTDFVRNVDSFIKGKERTANLVRSGLAATGALTGMVPDQIAKLAELAVRVGKGDYPRKGFAGAKFEEPKTWLPALTGQNQDTWFHGLRTGKFREQKR